MLKAGRQNAFGHDEKPRIAAKALLEPDLPPHFPADCPPAFLGYPPRNRADGDPAGLQQDHRTGIGQRRRNARGFAGAGKGRNYYGPFSRKRFPDLAQAGINW